MLLQARRTLPLIFRHTGGTRTDGRQGFSWKDLRDLLTAAHTQLRGSIVLVWDNVGIHVSRAMRDWITARDRLTAHQLPAYAPDLNLVEGIWSSLWSSLRRTQWPTSPSPTTPPGHHLWGAAKVSLLGAV